MLDRPAYMRSWRLKNQNHIRAYDNKYYKSHTSAGREQAKKWRVNNHEYTIWLKMLWRCQNINAKDYKNYGGRGIRVTYKDFYSFLADVGPRPSGCSIDRIDNNGNYEVGNCRWATSKEQRHNQRRYK